MHTIRLLSKALHRLVPGLALLPLVLGSLSGQTSSANGTITGRVYDERNGKSLEGATVRVFRTNAIDHTTNEGRYSVSAPPGVALLEVEYLGLDSVTREVVVTAGGTTRFDVPLTSTVYKMESFVVQDSVRGQSLAINMQKIAPSIVNIVSEETFGQMTDANIGTAIQRLPGLSVNESQDGSAGSINIRGIEGDYNAIMVDGNRAPSASGTSRGFDPRQLAADGMTNLEIIKSPTPDRDGDAIGGIVNIVSRSAFQRDGRAVRIKAGGVYSDLPKKWGYQSTLQYSDIFNLGRGEKNLGISATVSSYRTNRYSINADIDWEHVDDTLYPQMNLKENYGDYPVWFLESSHFEWNNRVTDTQSFNASIDYRTDENNSFYFRPLYSYYDRKGTTAEVDQDIDTRYQADPGGRRTYAFLTIDSGGATPGANGSRGSRGWIGTDDIANNNLYSFNFGGRHERPNSLLTYDLYYSFSKLKVEADNQFDVYSQPTNPYYLVNYKINDIHKGDVAFTDTSGLDPYDVSLISYANVIFAHSVKEERVYSARFDWEKKFDIGEGQFTFKTGAKYRRAEPRYDIDQYRRRTVGGLAFPWERVMQRTDEWQFGKKRYWDVYPNRVTAIMASNPELFTNDLANQLNLTIEGSNIRDYNASEETSAGFVMGTYRLGRHMILAGIRYEDNEWKSQRVRVPYINGVATPMREDLGRTYDQWLPGIHFRHELRKNLIMRESYNQSYAKPKLGALTLGRIVANNGNITDGNPKLNPATSQNLDWQVEYYTASSGLYSVGVFYKDVKDFSFQQDSRFLTVDASGEPIIIPGATSGLRYRRQVDGGKAKQGGVELIARQRINIGPKFLHGFTAGTSATFTDSKATYPGREDRTDLTLAGFSPYLFTASLEYARGGLFVRADYRYRDSYVEGLGTDRDSDEYYSAEERVDAEISYEIRKGLSVYASGTNLTNRWLNSYQGFKQFIEDASLSGRKFTVGMEYKF